MRKKPVQHIQYGFLAAGLHIISLQNDSKVSCAHLLHHLGSNTLFSILDGLKAAPAYYIHHLGSITQ
jgi:hypothetical protein